MIVLGLTGGMASGKSAALRMFGEAGAATFDSDACARALYASGGEGAEALRGLAPEALAADGSADREILSRLVCEDEEFLSRLESAIHPLIASRRAAFVSSARERGDAEAVCEVPLLFETDAADEFDASATVSTPTATRRRRAMSRPGMTEAKLETLSRRQLSDAERRARADYVIRGDDGMERMASDVLAVLADLRRARAEGRL